jgi:5-methylcytosine-specific restriction protein A
MPRREFSASVKKARLKHANGMCEGCSQPLGSGFHFDHDVPDGLGGEPTFENCRVLCIGCHKIKTKDDKAMMSKADAVRAKHEKTRAPPRKKLEGQGFAKAEKPRKPPLYPNLPPPRLMR